jgi:hypothetical protein
VILTEIPIVTFRRRMRGFERMDTWIHQTYGLIEVRWNLLEDDEHRLAWHDEAELAAGEFFDRSRILPQTSRFFAEVRVLDPLTSDGRRQLVVHAGRLDYSQQPVLVEQPVDGDGCREEEEEQIPYSAACGKSGSWWHR